MKHMIINILFLAAGCIVTILYYESRPEAAEPVPEDSVPVSVKAISKPVVTEKKKSEEKPESLLVDLGAHIRSLQERKAELTEKDRELRISYRILREQGHAADDPMCRRLVASCRQHEEALAEIDAHLKKARIMEADLQDLIARRKITAVSDDPEMVRLIHNVRVLIMRNGSNIGDESLIPSEQWKGGTDTYMSGRDTSLID